MKRLLIYLWLLCSVTPAVFAADSDDPAIALIEAACPQIRAGGSHADDFAAWANTQYLLRDAFTIGEVGIGVNANAQLFIAQGTPVLAVWSTTDAPASVCIALGQRAKLYASGNATRAVTGKFLDISPRRTPVFVRGVAPEYVATALRAYFLSLDDDPQLKAVLGDDAWTTLQQRIMAVDAVLTEKRWLKLVPPLLELERTLDTTLHAILQPVADDSAGVRFSLARQLLQVRLRLCEAHIGVSQWQRQLPKLRTISEIERIQISGTLLHLLAQAEPKTALRGRPVTGRLLREALVDLSRTADSIAPREQARLSFFLWILPQCLPAEPLCVQNIQSVATFVHRDAEMRLTVRVSNTAAEEAQGTLHLTWPGGTATDTLRLPANSSVEYRYPCATVPLGDQSVQISGLLTDGTPLLQMSLPIQ